MQKANIRHGVLLFLATIVIETCTSGAARFALGFGLAILSGQWDEAVLFGVLAALIPIVLQTILCLFDFVKLPIAHRGMVRAIGARQPSDREVLEIHDLITQIEAERPLTTRPVAFYIFDGMFSKARPIGKVIYLERGILSSPYALVLLTHALGMLDSNAAWFRLPLRLYDMTSQRLRQEFGLAEPVERETNRPLIGGFKNDVQILTQIIGFLWKLAKGGCAEVALKKEWASYWRDVTYTADQFVVQQGLRDELLAYLEYAQAFDRMTPEAKRNEPYAEERIAALLKQSPPREQQVSA